MRGYDVHRLVTGRKLILGGVDIPHETGLLGHSDADVLTHAVMDALLGAAAMGDIGHLFPDNDPAYAGADSLALLREVTARLHAAGYTVGNLDCTVLAQQERYVISVKNPRSGAEARAAHRADAPQSGAVHGRGRGPRQRQGDDRGGPRLHRHARGHRRARGRPDRTDFVNACAAPA